MLINSFAFLALSAISSAASLPHRRSSESGLTLYAYGTAANGAAIWYADGLAYFGKGDASLDATVKTNISFTVDPDDTTVAWTIQPNATSNPTVSFNETLDLYIVPTDDSFTQAGFASSNSSSLPTGAVTTGFSFFGTSVAYAASESDYEMMFWANATTTEGVYALYWNAGSSSAPDSSFAVVVKTTPPISF
ncbi:uncharacterized protein PAC_09746 [Phialocephala subalpina]|uniref:Uncharacterized protein n=1 Tax=Phialocephala subalpina TaxID=576137 RepID=A0A1L7X4C5_9HELO|nr:uncharacterized protein PAC_09746 [Phialocephala subalpina]